MKPPNFMPITIFVLSLLFPKSVVQKNQYKKVKFQQQYCHPEDRHIYNSPKTIPRHIPRQQSVSENLSMASSTTQPIKKIMKENHIVQHTVSRKNLLCSFISMLLDVWEIRNLKRDRLSQQYSKALGTTSPKVK